MNLPASPDIQYDYIIAGAGCAGLSLAMHLCTSGKFTDKRILLVDRDAKQSNDRTWCFWEQRPGLFEPVVYRQWDQLWFHGTGYAEKLVITPYKYKMIRGIDFYNHCLKELRNYCQVQVCQEAVESVFSDGEGTGVVIQGRKIFSEYVFNSILFEKPELRKTEYWLLQHFKGWVIETAEPVFDPAVGTLMDFRVDQQQGTAFCYVLPFSKNRALVEYTVFSGSTFTEDAYKQGLAQYIGDVLKVKEYKVLDVETGAIPMTNHRFSPGYKRLINIGTAGGQTKGSSGYTFSFIQKHSKAIVSSLLNGEDPLLLNGRTRHHFYDSVLLNILQNNTLPGAAIFTKLFRRNKPARVLKFLDNESSFAEELQIIATLPTLPFTKAALQQIF